MSSPSVEALVEFYLPVLATAGDYARQIQPRIGIQDEKSGVNRWTQALTDADLMVQAYVEVVTLANFPAVGFFGEESEQSVNSKYFPQSAETSVYLDPINATFLYKNQKTNWDIVLSIVERGRLVAAISFMPMRGRFYLAIQGCGALTGNSDARGIDDLQPLTTISGSRVCMTYRAPQVTARVAGAFECVDIVDDYDPERGLDNLNDMFTGKLDAYSSERCQPLDWGATAFIVANAGGRATHFDGTSLDIFADYDPLRPTDLVVSTTPGIHDEILTLLRS